MNVEGSFFLGFGFELVFGIIIKGCFVGELFVLEGFVVKGVCKCWLALVTLSQGDSQIAWIVDLN